MSGGHEVSQTMRLKDSFLLQIAALSYSTEVHSDTLHRSPMTTFLDHWDCALFDGDLIR